MKVVKLTDICRPKQWKTISTRDFLSEGYPVFGANGKIGFYSEFNHESPTIMITCRGATCGRINISEPFSYINGNAMALDDLVLDVDLKFLYYYLSNTNLNDCISGSAQPQITRSGLERIQIPLPPLPEQKRIAEILDKADALRQKNKQLLAAYDELLQATFLDMFGDPVTNPKGWEKIQLSDVADVVSGVTKGRKLKDKELIELPYMRVANVQDGHLVLDDIKTIEVLHSDLVKFKLLPKDILLTEGGDPDKLGRGAVWHGEIDNCIHQNHIYRVRLKNEDLNEVYLSALIGSTYGKRYFLKAAKQTTGIATINSTQLKQFPVILAPIKIQKQYKTAVENIEAQKAKLKQGMQESDDLFGALVQKAFANASVDKNN
jgi:type I restriction enzyme S subunit